MACRLKRTASNTGSSELKLEADLPKMSLPIFSALAVRSSRYNSQLRDMDEFLFDDSTSARFHPTKGYEVHASAEELFEFILQIKVTHERTWRVRRT